MFSASAGRILATAVLTTATMYVGSAVALAAPFNVQPTPTICPGGMGPVDVTALPGGRLAVSVPEPPPAGGGRVVWVNTSTGATGITTLTNNGDRAEVIADTGPGTVITTIDGVYTNGAGQPCVLAQGGVGTTVVP
ncbi:amidohydrolase [Rhodococcus spongiicola]|uniref:Amidohydrolase n=1 Tax=Rhodococcus spongiicola TaxID=2487352 RepID=A0A3S3E5P3_9NOCA|nr:amidohydrolase [Rhodococcus spongiicola]RVW05930.1 amidohydrolase [Rhodococcus spongiicola]